MGKYTLSTSTYAELNEAFYNKKKEVLTLGAIDNSKKEAKDLIYCFHATIPNLCHVPKHAYK